jgi:hypothetical protein
VEKSSPILCAISVIFLKAARVGEQTQGSFDFVYYLIPSLYR